GSPSAYFSFAVPQDGKAAPADFNASGSAYIRNVWNGTGTCSNAPLTTTRTGAGTLNGPDASGYYTMKLSCVTIPPSATMLTGGIGYTYSLGSVQADPTLNFINNNQPLTQTRCASSAPAAKGCLIETPSCPPAVGPVCGYKYVPNASGQSGT